MRALENQIFGLKMRFSTILTDFVPNKMRELFDLSDMTFIL